MIYIIPARKNSKGLSYKNRMLFEYTAKTIPSDIAPFVYVTTDDDEIIKLAKKYKFRTYRRHKNLSGDEVSIKHVLRDLIVNRNITDDITMLYLTYPRRTWEDIVKFHDFFNEHKKPTVCKKNIDNHPFLCYYSIDEHKGKKVVQHDLYRRQDYPECFQICHFLFSCKSEDVDRLDLNLFCDDTMFYQIDSDKCLDIDTYNDYKNIKEKK